MSGYLLDTNIPSELIRSQPDPQVLAWMQAQSEGSLLLSVITLGELRKGISLLLPGKRRTLLELWLRDDLVPRFRARILPITHEIADAWGAMHGERKRIGKPLPIADGLIAATAQVHGLVLVTRNDKDFSSLDIALLNPWNEQDGLHL